MPHRCEKLVTPDGRYFVVRGRLWRLANPELRDVDRENHVATLMSARRAVAAAKRVGDVDAEEKAHAAVDRAKRALGERGPVWWTDGAPDYNRKMARNTPYAGWYAEAQANRVVIEVSRRRSISIVDKEKQPDSWYCPYE